MASPVRRERSRVMSAISRAPVPGAVPQNASGDATRRRLLEAATRLFSEHGYAAVTVRDITRAAETNLAAVNYHFGGKLGLYEAVRDGIPSRRRTVPRADKS